MYLDLSKIDYFFIVFSLFTWWLFVLIWIEKLYKFYFWIILAFFLFIITNLHIKVLWSSNIWTIEFKDTSFLLKNKSFILSFLTTMIPFLWIFMYSTDFISFKVVNNRWFSFIIWWILPFFILSIFVYIWVNSVVPISFLVDLFKWFENTFFFDFFSVRSYFAIYFLFFVLFFRIGIFIFVWLWVYVFNKFYISLKEDVSWQKKHGDSHDSHWDEHWWHWYNEEESHNDTHWHGHH